MRHYVCVTTIISFWRRHILLITLFKFNSEEFMYKLSQNSVLYLFNSTKINIGNKYLFSRFFTSI